MFGGFPAGKSRYQVSLDAFSVIATSRALTVFRGVSGSLPVLAFLLSQVPQWAMMNINMILKCMIMPEGFLLCIASFGAAHNADCVVPTATMLDFYNGGGVDIACLGAAEVDAEGNVNVHSFPGRQPGCGGFIDISQAAKKVVFAGTFTAGGLKASPQFLPCIPALPQL
jgi:hypothetical protein